MRNRETVEIAFRSSFSIHRPRRGPGHRYLGCVCEEDVKQTLFDPVLLSGILPGTEGYELVTTEFGL